jgi:hypothetical protein
VLNQQPLARVDVAARVKEYTDHLKDIEGVFNSHALELGLGVRLDASGAIAAVKHGAGIARVMRFCDRPDDSGVLHDSQLMTALDCVGELLTSPRNNGLVLGAMQSGKTTTSLCLQFAGPIVHLLTGRSLYPIYLITSHTSQEDQTKIEISRFLDFYGELAVAVDDKRRCTLIQYVHGFQIDPVFAYSPTINTYREHVLKNAFPDTLVGPRLEDFFNAAFGETAFERWWISAAERIRKASRRSSSSTSRSTVLAIGWSRSRMGSNVGPACCCRYSTRSTMR